MVAEVKGHATDVVERRVSNRQGNLEGCPAGENAGREVHSMGGLGDATVKE